MDKSLAGLTSPDADLSYELQCLMTDLSEEWASASATLDEVKEFKSLSSTNVNSSDGSFPWSQPNPHCWLAGNGCVYTRISTIAIFDQDHRFIPWPDSTDGFINFNK